MSRTFITKYESTCPAQTGVLRATDASASIQEGYLTITPVIIIGSSNFGAEVAGVNWSQPISPEIVKQVNHHITS